jgi:hypothetical protein
MPEEQFIKESLNAAAGQTVTVRARTLAKKMPSEWVTATVTMPSSLPPQSPHVLRGGYHHEAIDGNWTLWLHAWLMPQESLIERGFEPVANLSYRLQYRAVGDSGDWYAGWPTEAANLTEYISGEDSSQNAVFVKVSIPGEGDWDLQAVAVNNAGESLPANVTEGGDFEFSANDTGFIGDLPS